MIIMHIYPAFTLEELFTLTSYSSFVNKNRVFARSFITVLLEQMVLIYKVKRELAILSLFVARIFIRLEVFM
ncbi:hypothetical protein theurythT_25500 [Thalassotalea eurytherma]|uniref:Uncharacterized protein n=1 Tax=Thalassotalea eurytherma TaxID=1144278 RepID=A0ABQ6H4L7_9GAMM|nr:hypothetical protein theurythT_25500 [Thalassotalea eurytherma]